MRTTITLDEDVAVKLRQIAAERGWSFKQAVNQTLRAGFAAAGDASPHRTPTTPMGLRAGIDVRKALALAAQLEDEGILRKLELRK